jgi:glycosyltransferase involved in cell wall biosynthesis
MNKISLVMPLYNKEEHVKRALDSVLNQTRAPDEIIVVDDGSTDKGAEVVKSYHDKRIKLIEQKNSGVSIARNNAILQSSYDFIAFLDADDAWKPDYLETIHRLILEYPECAAFATSYSMIIDGYEKVISHGINGVIDDYFKIGNKKSIPFNVASIVIRKTVFENVGYFPESVAMGEDLDMWCRLAMDYDIAICDKTLALYYLNASNRATNNIVQTNEFYYSQQLQEKLNKGEIPKEKINSVQQFISLGLQRLAFDNLKNGYKGTAWKVVGDKRSYKVLSLTLLYIFILIITPSSLIQKLLDIKSNYLS